MKLEEINPGDISPEKIKDVFDEEDEEDEGIEMIHIHFDDIVINIHQATDDEMEEYGNRLYHENFLNEDLEREIREIEEEEIASGEWDLIPPEDDE